MGAVLAASTTEAALRVIMWATMLGDFGVGRCKMTEIQCQ